MIELYVLFHLTHATPKPIWTYPTWAACEHVAGDFNQAERKYGDGLAEYYCAEPKKPS